MIFGLALKEVLGGRGALWGLGAWVAEFYLSAAWTLSEICEALISKPSSIPCQSMQVKFVYFCLS
jgi:hypothetical protein